MNTFENPDSPVSNFSKIYNNKTPQCSHKDRRRDQQDKIETRQVRPCIYQQFPATNVQS